MMAATLIMCFAFSLSVMAAPSPEDEYDRESPEQTNVDKIIIDPTPLTIDLTDTSLAIQTKGVNPGVYDVHFQIFSKEGYRLIKSLKVTVSE